MTDQKENIMGIDLRLLPFDGPDFSHTVLSCERTPDLFDKIKQLPQRTIDGRFATFLNTGDPSYGDTKIDPYGDTLCYVLAEELAGIDLPDIKTGTNRAIWAYLRASPWRTKVALYWH